MPRWSFTSTCTATVRPGTSQSGGVDPTHFQWFGRERDDRFAGEVGAQVCGLTGQVVAQGAGHHRFQPLVFNRRQAQLVFTGVGGGRADQGGVRNDGEQAAFTPRDGDAQYFVPSLVSATTSTSITEPSRLSSATWVPATASAVFGAGVSPASDSMPWARNGFSARIRSSSADPRPRSGRSWRTTARRRRRRRRSATGRDRVGARRTAAEDVPHPGQQSTRTRTPRRIRGVRARSRITRSEECPPEGRDRRGRPEAWAGWGDWRRTASFRIPVCGWAEFRVVFWAGSGCARSRRAGCVRGFLAWCVLLSRAFWCDACRRSSCGRPSSLRPSGDFVRGRRRAEDHRARLVVRRRRVAPVAAKPRPGGEDSATVVATRAPSSPPASAPSPAIISVRRRSEDLTTVSPSPHRHSLLPATRGFSKDRSAPTRDARP